MAETILPYIFRHLGFEYCVTPAAVTGGPGPVGGEIERAHQAIALYHHLRALSRERRQIEQLEQKYVGGGERQVGYDHAIRDVFGLLRTGVSVEAEPEDALQTIREHLRRSASGSARWTQPLRIFGTRR